MRKSVLGKILNLVFRSKEESESKRNIEKNNSIEGKTTKEEVGKGRMKEGVATPKVVNTVQDVDRELGNKTKTNTKESKFGYSSISKEDKKEGLESKTKATEKYKPGVRYRHKHKTVAPKKEVVVSKLDLEDTNFKVELKEVEELKTETKNDIKVKNKTNDKKENNIKDEVDLSLNKKVEKELKVKTYINNTVGTGTYFTKRSHININGTDFKYYECECGGLGVLKNDTVKCSRCDNSETLEDLLKKDKTVVKVTKDKKEKTDNNKNDIKKELNEVK